jgi:hypothetical protein
MDAARSATRSGTVRLNFASPFSKHPTVAAFQKISELAARQTILDAIGNLLADGR